MGQRGFEQLEKTIVEALAVAAEHPGNPSARQVAAHALAAAIDRFVDARIADTQNRDRGR